MKKLLLSLLLITTIFAQAVANTDHPLVKVFTAINPDSPIFTSVKEIGKAVAIELNRTKTARKTCIIKGFVSEALESFNEIELHKRGLKPFVQLARLAWSECRPLLKGDIKAYNEWKAYKKVSNVINVTDDIIGPIINIRNAPAVVAALKAFGKAVAQECNTVLTKNERAEFVMVLMGNIQCKRALLKDDNYDMSGLFISPEETHKALFILAKPLIEGFIQNIRYPGLFWGRMEVTNSMSLDEIINEMDNVDREDRERQGIQEEEYDTGLSSEL